MIDPDYYGDVVRRVKNAGISIPKTPGLASEHLRASISETLIEDATFLRGNIDVVEYAILIMSSVNALLFLAACSGLPFDRVWEVGENHLRKVTVDAQDTALFRAQLEQVLGLS